MTSTTANGHPAVAHTGLFHGYGPVGVELVEGRDLFCRDNVVYLRTTEGNDRST
ncbi:circularly permuted ATPgrasp domain protein [Nocardia ignorata]|uniref:Circularly permuted ATPgrasp domain protein n=1 Tax=Nocardia ignorata TaxID=145285 RepID=A0A4R6PL23_NOCIG|nr:circularly permuted ATPgrasp domain protein [Nocardia ignorata]